MPHSGVHREAIGEITQKTNLKGEALANAIAEAMDCPKNMTTKKVTSNKKKK